MKLRIKFTDAAEKSTTKTFNPTANTDVTLKKFANAYLALTKAVSSTAIKITEADLPLNE